MRALAPRPAKKVQHRLSQPGGGPHLPQVAGSTAAANSSLSGRHTELWTPSGKPPVAKVHSVRCPTRTGGSHLSQVRARRKAEVDVDQRDELRKLADNKIVAESGEALDHVGEAAARLLADLYAIGLAHDVTPQDWAAVTALPGACWDAARALDRRQQMAAERMRIMTGRLPFDPASAVGTHHDADDVRGTRLHVVAPPVAPIRLGRGFGR